MNFWTLDTPTSPTGQTTLCDDCALEATNMGVLDHAAGRGLEPDLFGSMPEAAAILTALLAAIGESLGITSRPHGRCDECGAEVPEEVNV